MQGVVCHLRDIGDTRLKEWLHRDTSDETERRLWRASQSAEW